MKKGNLKLRFLLVVGILLFGPMGCKEPIPTDLNEYAGIWKLQDSFLESEGFSDEAATTVYYFVINASNNTSEVWTNRGFEEQFSIDPGTGGSTKWIHTRTPRNPDWDGSEFIADLSRNGDVLSTKLHSVDNSWNWSPVFDRVSSLPVFSYSNDFENGNLDLIMVSHGTGSTQEWEITAEPGNASNNILKPVYSNGNSDLDIKIRPGGNYTITYDIKRLKQADDTASCWTVLDFNMYPENGVYNSFWL
ncbi:MAG: hypothetical protein KAR21_04625, partial [Spirochaetales bacterium]|nr:hypothetical protein [Spirochaetales bacterium]